ncbi:hypothetical protein HKD37_18G051249 [Glycine soja]
MTYEATKEIAEKIDSLEEQSSQGSFVAHGRQDVLTAAIGRPEHPGHVRAAGAGVMINQMQSQFQSQMQSQGLTMPPEPEVSPSATRVSTKESCVDPSGNDPDAGDSDKCGLYIEENPPHLVALGRLSEGSTTVHNIPLLHDQVKVGVEEVRDTDAPIPVPTKEEAVGLAKLIDKVDLDVNDPIYLMTLTIPQLFLKPLQSVYIIIYYLTYCFKFIHNLLYVNNNGHMTETSNGEGNADVYGFLEPQSIQRSGQSQFESESYIKNWMQNSKRDVYLGSYLNEPDNYLNGIINSALKGLDNTPQSKSKVVARWIVVKCNRQNGSTECGYYVMHLMSTIILGSFKNNWETIIV